MSDINKDPFKERDSGIETPQETMAAAAGPNLNYLSLATIRQGSTGVNVKFAQKMLYLFVQDMINQPIHIDGSFGAATKIAVEKFQQLNGRTVDGVIGPSTWQRLCPAVMAGYVPSVYPRADRAIKEVQRMLVLGNRLNNTDMDGAYGTRTMNAIKSFQGAYGLAQDGAFGRQSWGITEQGFF